MTSGEVRDLLLFAGMILLVILLLASRHRGTGSVPPTVAPISQPVEEAVRDIRHRMASVEQQIPVLTDHALRLRSVERELSEVKAVLNAITQGQARMEKQLDMLVEHQLDRERPA